MNQIAESLEFFAAFALAIEVAFETLYSLPFVDSYFKKHKERAYLKRVFILVFCFMLCAALYVATSPEDGALFLERLFHKRVPYVDILLTSFILAGGTHSVHDMLQRLNGRVAQKILETKPT